jgi:hypothetical protein
LPQEGDSTPPLLAIRGRNFLGNHPVDVRIGGEPVPVVRANPREVLVAPQPHQLHGDLTIQTAPGRSATTRFNLAGAPVAASSVESQEAEP